MAHRNARLTPVTRLELVREVEAGVRPARCVTEVEVGVRQCAEAEPASERGGEQQARMVHEAVVIEGDVYPVGVARW